jgi:hypothetical protein
MIPAALVVSLVIAVAGAGEAMVSTQEGLPVTVVDEGTLSGIDERRQAVVRTEDEWRALWREHAGEREMPRLDFSRVTVLAVFAGTRPTAGWTVKVKSVLPDADGVRVSLAESGPGPGQMAAQILTAPFQIVSVPRFSGAAVFSGSR